MAWLAWRGAYVRGLGLKSKKGWEVWRKNGRPSDIPSEPSIVYRDDGWISWSDWLGFKGRAPPGGMLPFAVGRAYARKLKLRRTREWKAWSKSGRRPFNIPSNPDTTYRDDGWISWPDWIGYGSAGGAAASRSSSSSSSATTRRRRRSRRRRAGAAPPPPIRPAAAQPRRRRRSRRRRAGAAPPPPIRAMPRGLTASAVAVEAKQPTR